MYLSEHNKCLTFLAFLRDNMLLGNRKFTVRLDRVYFRREVYVNLCFDFTMTDDFELVDLTTNLPVAPIKDPTPDGFTQIAFSILLS